MIKFICPKDGWNLYEYDMTTDSSFYSYEVCPVCSTEYSLEATVTKHKGR